MTRVAIACLALGVLWLFCKSGVPSASAVETLPHETLDHIWATKSDRKTARFYICCVAEAATGVMPGAMG